MRPIDDVGKIAQRPLLLVHGDQDTLVPLGKAQALYKAAREPKQSYIVHEAGYGGFLDADPMGFERTLVEYYQKYLLSP